MNIQETKEYVKSKSKKAIKRGALGALAYGINKIPGMAKGLDKLKDKTGYTKLKKKIPKGFSVGYNPDTGKASMGFKLKF